MEGAGTVLAERGRRRVYPIGQRSQHQEGISRKALAILTVCEVWPIDPVILRSGSTGWEGRVSKCARAGRVLEAVSPRLGHRHTRADWSMRCGEARRTKRQGSYFQGEGGLTLSLLRLQALLARPSRFHERVGNGDTFKTCYCTPSDSKPFPNGEGVPVSGTYAPAPGTHPLNRDRQKDEATGRGECGGAPRSGATGETDTAETTRTAEV